MKAPSWRVLELSEVDSTQDEVRRRLEAGEDIHGLVVRAKVQTAGRGQRSRDWHSGPGGSWQTAGLSGHALPASSLFMAIGIVRELNSALGQPVLKLKWPNDILCGDLKVAGILSEYTRRHLLVGVGVNVRNQVPAGAAALDQLEPGDVHELVLDGIRAGWLMMHHSSHELAEAYAEFDSLRGRQLQFERAGVRHQGVASGVDLAGRLRLQTDQGVKLIDSVSTLRAAQAP